MHRRARHYSNSLTIVSNIAFLLPAWLLYSQDNYLLAGMVCVIMIISTLYHSTKPAGIDSPWIPKKRTRQHRLLLWSDVLLTIGLGIYVFVVHLLPMIPADSVRFELTLIVFILGVLLYAFPTNHYEVKHSLWHILAASALYLVFM